MVSVCKSGENVGIKLNYCFQNKKKKWLYFIITNIKKHRMHVHVGTYFKILPSKKGLYFFDEAFGYLYLFKV